MWPWPAGRHAWSLGWSASKDNIIVRMRTICSLVPQNTVAYSTKFAQSEFRTASDERAGPGNEANAVRYRRSMTYKHVIRDRVSRSLCMILPTNDDVFSYIAVGLVPVSKS